MGDNFQRLMFYPENEAHAKPTSTHLMAINFLKHQLARRPASFAWLQKGGKLMNYDRRIPIKNTTKRSSMPIKTRQNDLVCRLKPDKTAPFLPAAIRLQIHTLQQITMPRLIAGAPKLNGRSVTSGKYQNRGGILIALWYDDAGGQLWSITDEDF